MKRKKIITIIASTLLVAFTLVGCGKKTSNEANVSNASGQEETTEDETPVLDENGLPHIDATIEIKTIDTSIYNNKYLDVAYADKSETEKLDIYLPESGDGPFPVLVYVHGGGFMIGDKREGDVIEAALKGLEKGYAVISVNYRLSKEAKFPAAIEDVNAAIRFIKANAEKYKLNPDKIALWGESAGGNLVSLAGTTADTGEFQDDSLGNPGVSTSVQVVIDHYGPLNFLKMDEQFAKSGITAIMGKTSVETSAESQYIGKLITDVPETVAKADPDNYITKNDPIFFIQHGSADQNVPTEQSIEFAENLKKVLGEDKVTMEVIEGAEHGDVGDVKGFYTDENVNKIFNFLDNNLK